MRQRSAAELQALRQVLRTLQHDQDTRLEALETSYTELLRQRRNELLALCRDAGARDTQHRLRTAHEHAQAELGAFCKVRVLLGWQEGEMLRQVRTLKEAQVLPTVLIDAANADVGQLRAFIQYVMQATL